MDEQEKGEQTDLSKVLDVGTDDPADEQLALEDKYRDQMRQIVSQKIELPISALVAMIKDQINLNPEFQRRDRWDGKKRSRFIESIVMNVPIPPVFLGETEYGTYVVLDGRQRLTALFEYLSNGYALSGLKVWSELNGLRFADVQKRNLDRAITRRFIPAVVVLKESSSAVKYDVFDRLNTGGVVAEPMEIRNALYHGPFNKHIRVLSDDQTFRKVWDIPVDKIQREANSLYQKMYDLELVLRFFALQEYGAMSLKFKDFLSECMDKRNSAYLANPELEAQDAVLFHRAVRASWAAFGGNAFRRPQADGTYSQKRSAPLSDGVLFALSKLKSEVIDPEQGKALQTALAGLCNANDEYKKSVSIGTNGKGAIKYRLEKTLEGFKRALGGKRVRIVIGLWPPCAMPWQSSKRRCSVSAILRTTLLSVRPQRSRTER